MAILAADGTPYHYAGNGENPVFTFRLGRDPGRLDRDLLDRSLALPVRRPRCPDRRLVPLRTTVSLPATGHLSA